MNFFSGSDEIAREKLIKLLHLVRSAILRTPLVQATKLYSATCLAGQAGG